MIVLNTIMADRLTQFKTEVDGLIAGGKDKVAAINEVLRRYISESKRVLFEGNGYGDEWAVEAAKRGLSNLKDVPTALKAYTTAKSKAVFAKNNIMNEREIDARYEILLESFIKKIQIESRVLADLANTSVIPAAISFQYKLTQFAIAMKELGLSENNYKVAIDAIKEASEYINTIKAAVYKMVDERRIANAMDSHEQCAVAYSEKVKAYFDTIREASDKLERIIEDNLWPLPKYRELLFVK